MSRQSQRDQQAGQFARNVLKDCPHPETKSEYKSDLETAFEAGWDAAVAYLAKCAKQSGAGVS